MFHYVIFRYRSNILRNVLYQYHNCYKRSSHYLETHPHLGPRPRSSGHERAQRDAFVYSQKSPVFGQFLFNAIVFSVEGQANRELKEPSSEKIIIKPDMLNPNFTLDSSRTGTSLVIPEVIKNQTGNGFRILDLSLFSNFQTDNTAHSKFQ